MFEFKSKVIFIVSQEDWGEMFISKHHYAVELASRGNVVYFINHPDLNHKLRRGEFRIEETEFPNLYVVKHRMWIPYFIKYDFPSFYNFLVRFHIHYLIKKIGIKPNIVWSFDLSNTLPIVHFSSAKLKVFMPVDSPFWLYSINAAIGADVIFSVTEEILEKYKDFKVPRIFVNHGVSKSFLGRNGRIGESGPIRVGYSGSLLRNEIDRSTLLDLVVKHPDVQFEFWGEYDYSKSFINVKRNRNEETINFVGRLKSLRNVIMHGVVSTTILSKKLAEMDVLLICYDINKDQSRGTNYHKILEYLATGKVVLSNNISTYSNLFPGLIQMLETRDNNNGMSELFDSIISNLSDYNSMENQTKRIDFAEQFSYAKQVDKIEKILSDLSSR